MARQNGRGHGVYNSLSQAYMLIHFIFSELHASADLRKAAVVEKAPSSEHLGD
jgi:hypothetical protein